MKSFKNFQPASHRPASRNEAGNVLFFILIAIVLLAALSLAVSQSGRGNISAVTNENARIYATQIIEYSNAVSQAVAQVRLRGASETDLCFESTLWPAGAAYDYNHAGCGDNANNIFHPDGGGVNWSVPPVEAVTAAFTATNYWFFNGQTTVTNVGTTGADNDNVELVMYALGLDDLVCQQINSVLGLADLADPIPGDDGPGTSPFTGAYATTASVIGTNALLRGQKAGCFDSANLSGNVYYKVLQAR